MRLLSIALLFCAACIDDFDPQSLVTRDRVLGVRLDVVTDEAPNGTGVAWPAPGDAVRAQVLVVDPEAPMPRSFVLLACARATTGTAASFCAGDPFAFTTEPAPVDAPVEIAFDVPRSIESGATLLLAGAVCANGSVTFDPSDPTAEPCSEGAQSTALTFTSPILETDEPNHHPVLVADGRAIALDDEPWTETSGECDDLPHVAAGTEDVKIVVELLDSARERYMGRDADGQPVERREMLTVATYATDGEVSGLFDVLDDYRPRTEVEWNAPPKGEVDEETVVRFFLTVRDGRGGFDYAERALCVTP